MPRQTCQAQIKLIFQKRGFIQVEKLHTNVIIKFIIQNIRSALREPDRENLRQEHASNTKYGVRTNRPTANAILLMKQVVDTGERIGNQLHVTSFDWNNAFEKLSPKALFKAVARMGILAKLVKTAAMMYQELTFIVDVEGEQSNWKRQRKEYRKAAQCHSVWFPVVMATIAMFQDFQQKTQHPPTTRRPETHGQREPTVRRSCMLMT